MEFIQRALGIFNRKIRDYHCQDRVDYINLPQLGVEAIVVFYRKLRIDYHDDFLIVFWESGNGEIKWEKIEVPMYHEPSDEDVKVSDNGELIFSFGDIKRVIPREKLK